jgi:signal transduction histidine kinase
VQQEKLASLGALTAGIAHEIKNPLNFVNNFAEVNEEIAEDALADLEAGRFEDLKATLVDLKRNANAIAEHGKRADGIVKGMMAHASGERRERTAVDLNELVSEYVDLAYHGKRAQSSNFKVELKRDFGVDVGEVMAVGPDLGRVVLNLVGNAFDAVTERATKEENFEPAVSVSTTRRDGQATVSVADNGGGVPDDVRDRIFEPFFTTKPSGSGTGLGLSLSHEIVTAGHNGSLTLDSRVGEGATFTITLPAV